MFFYCVILCFKLRERTYTRCDGYGNYIHGVRRMGKRINAKVRNYDLRDLDNEMNRKAYNFIEINELSGWKLAPLRK